MGFASILLATSIGETAATPAVVTTPATDTSARKSPQDPLEAEISDLGEAGVVGTELSPEVQNLENTLESGNALDEPSIVQEAPSQTDKLVGAITDFGQAFNTTNADMTGCSYADEGTGAYAQTLCWLNFDGFTTAYKNSDQLEMSKGEPVLGSARWTAAFGEPSRWWGDVKDYPVEADLGGGYVLSAQLDVSATDPTAKPVEGHHFPTWGSAFLGSTVNNFYTGIKGKPALYQMQNEGTSIVKLKNIKLQQNGKDVFDYSIVVADAETTDTGESIEWSTTGAGFEWLPNNPAGLVDQKSYMGNACDGEHIPRDLRGNSKNASCKAKSNTSKTGTPMLATGPSEGEDFEISQVLSGNGRQGVAFGVITARAAVKTEVTDRIINEYGVTADSTDFVGSIFQGGIPLIETKTGSILKESPQASSSLPVSRAGTQLRFESEAKGDLGDFYTSTWECRKTDPDTGNEISWPDAGGSREDFTLLKVGQFLECSIVYTPPYLTLEKEVDNGETEAADAADAFILRAAGKRSVFEEKGLRENDSVAVVKKRPIAVGEYELSEILPDPSLEENWSYGYDLRALTCTAANGVGILEAPKFSLEKNDRTISSGTLQVAKGDDITCRYTNVAREPRLEVAKEAFNAEGVELLTRDTAIKEQAVVSYKLTFTNSGTAPMDLAYVDHLGDVLDDAEFELGSVIISDGEETAYPEESMTNPEISVQVSGVDGAESNLSISGRVDHGQTRTVWFKVKVLLNADNVLERQTGSEESNHVGYMLNNYLLPKGESVPPTCEELVDVEASSCTTHPVAAWTVSKNSRPASGARLHKGGNTHYQITAQKMNPATQIEGLVFEDDLTHVFKTAGWAPNAAVPGGALKRGIYFFDATGQSLNENGESIGTISTPQPAFDENSGKVPAPEYDDGTKRWTITSEPVTLPENAMRAEMWFAVEAGQNPGNIPEFWPGDTTPAFGSIYANYVRASSENLEPNRCSLNSEKAVTSQNATRPRDHEGQYIFNDLTFPSECQVLHQMSDNYFTIRKDATGAGIAAHDGKWGDSTGLTNLVGHKFEIRDDIGQNGWNSPSAEPSKFLCRKEYNPANWDGIFRYEGIPDWGQDSETLASIIKHNNAYEEGDERRLPICALFYAQGTYGVHSDGTPRVDHAGGQNGRWRSEYLGEGYYWLVETKAPTKQIANTGNEERDVLGVQLLTEPIGFRVWPSGDGVFFGPESPQQSMEGRGQLDIRNAERKRCDPGADVATRPIACVNPTGYLMIVQDVVPLAMPLTGGSGPLLVMGGGGVILLSTLVGSWLWLRSKRGERDM